MNLITEVTSQFDKTDLTGLEQLHALMASGRRPGIAESLDFNLIEVGAGFAVFEGTPGQHAYNPIGMVHGRETVRDHDARAVLHQPVERFLHQPFALAVQ